MKGKLKSLFLVFVAMFCSTPLFAHDLEVDGFYYNITSSDDMTVEVTFRGNSYSAYYVYSGSLVIPESIDYNGNTYTVTRIGSYAFRYCDALVSVTIPNSVTSIGDGAFSGCPNLTSIDVPNSVESIGEGTFDDTPWNDNLPNGIVYVGNVLYKYKGTMPKGTAVEVKEGTASISHNAFSGCSGMTSITIPNSVASIGNSAFSGCSGLTSVATGDGVKSIGESAFWGCSKLTSITIGNSVKSIGVWAFNYCDCLTSVTIGNSLENIGDYAFDGCDRLTSIVIPNSTTYIGKGAFEYCSELVSITIPNSVEIIGEDAFYGTAWYANQLEGVVYAGNVLYKYKGEISLNTPIEVKEGTLSITPKAFEGCTGLVSITMPNSLVNIGERAFYDCSCLASVTIPNGVRSIGAYAFYDCDALTSLTIGDSVERIGYGAFRNCYGLVSVTIPNSVKTIEGGVFDSCRGLTSVTIGNSVSSIAEYVFNSCSALKEVISYIPAEKLFLISSHVFYGVPGSCVLTVPFGAKAKYAATRGWDRFGKNIVEMMEEPDTTDVVLTEGEDFENIYPFQANSVSYARTLPNLKWNALYLPVEIPVSTLSDNYDVAYFNNMHAYDRDDDGVIDDMAMEVIRISKGKLRANHPYFIRAKNEVARNMNLELTELKLHSTVDVHCKSIKTSSAYMDFELKGIYTSHSAEQLSGCYAITGSGSWAPIAVGASLNPFRFYLKITPRDDSPVLPDEALQTIHIYMQGEEGTTSIDETIVNVQESTVIYDLQGRRVVNPTRGMYIVNGKKVWVK
ncbi:MAG: leucine-rich repeat domain-containing protein [Bacteroidaceae bacterium]|nr:leucine-rich repeat domain-containing protein [Bacteroidaceae bacterium]